MPMNYEPQTLSDIVEQSMLVCAQSHDCCNECISSSIVNIVRNLEAAEYRKERHAHWMVLYDQLAACSTCHFQVIYFDTERLMFCSGCGARMDETEEFLPPNRYYELTSENDIRGRDEME